MRPPRVAAVVVVLLATAGPAAAQAPPADTPDPSIADGSAQRALDAARERWAARGLRSYRFTVRMLCFCPDTAPRRLTVRRGKPVAPPSHLRQVATVPRLFRVVQQAIDHRVTSLSVTYGATGLPRAVGIDVSRMIADEEVSYRASRLRPLG